MFKTRCHGAVTWFETRSGAGTTSTCPEPSTRRSGRPTPSRTTSRGSWPSTWDAGSGGPGQRFGEPGTRRWAGRPAHLGATPSTSGRSSSAPRPDRGLRCRCRAHAALPSLPARRRSPRGSYASAASPASPRGPPVTIPDANKDEQRQRSLCDVLDVGWSRTPVRFGDIDMTLRKTAGRHSVSALPVASGISECLVPVMRPWDHERENGVVSGSYSRVRH